MRTSLFSRPLRSLIGLSMAASALAAVPVAVASAAPATDLFISEYIEGSSFNKAIEIYNGTGGSVDLGAGSYTLELYSNGAATASQTVALTGSVAGGDVFVIAHGSANAAIAAQADLLSTSVINFNGDDAVVLRKAGVVIDAFGEIGFDPGSQWPGGGQDDTLRRKAAVCTGDADATDPFDASFEWDTLAQDTVDGLGAHVADCGGTSDPVLLINEVDADQDGTDAAEFVEIFDGGSGNTDLSGTVLVLYNGSNDLSYAAFDLDGLATDADGYFVLCSNAATVANCDLDVSPDTNLIQNGADAVALYRADAVDFPNNTAVATDNLLDALVYDTNDSDDTGLLTLLNAGQPQINESGGGDATIDSNQRCPNGSGGARNTETYAQFAPTPGTGNLCEVVVPPLSCTTPVAVTLISAVQGSGSSSPIAGQDVVLDAVVTGVFPDLNGIYIQEEAADADADASTSEGVFVFGGDQPAGLAPNDVVRVKGTVAEYVTSGGASSLTEIVSPTIIACGGAPGSISPVEVTLPFGSGSDLEAVEGMLVTLPQSLVISEYFNFDRFGETVLSSQRRLTPTAEFEPGPAAIAANAAALLDRLTIDDGRSSQNPDPAIHPGNGNVFDLDNTFRGGDTISGITGVIDDTFGIYRMQPVTYGSYSAQNPRSASPDAVGGNVTVASFNVLNYFTTLDNAGPICGPAASQDCRGADNETELTRQRDKIVAALAAIDADVVGLIEIENHAQDAAVNDLVASLNSATTAGTYAAIATGPIGTDAIKTALIYKPATVTPVGGYAVLDGSVDARFIDTKNRPVLAQTFSVNATAGIVTVAVNHLKSKGSNCNDVGDPDTGDGAGNCNLTRTAAAEALVDWLATDPTGSGSDAVLVIGDLNSYDKEAPIDAIIAGSDDAAGTGDDYTDLVASFQGEAAYSYVFDGLTGYLDHALASTALVGSVTGVTVWHINADEPDLLDYDTSFKAPAQDAIYAPDPFRSSDHDPVIIGLDVCDVIAPVVTQATATPDRLWPPNGKYVDVVTTIVATDNGDAAPVVSLVSVESNEPDDSTGDGKTINDIVVVDDTHFKLRAERSGQGSGRIYTITYQVTDSCGNSTIATVTVEVPHDKGA